MVNTVNRPSLAGTEDGSGGGGRQNVNTGILGAVTAAAIAFSTDANYINTEGSSLLVLANETVPDHDTRLQELAFQILGLSVRLSLLELRASGSGPSTYDY